eukprot:CAMPEP_0195524434 /NCGR_PEP_ID=MMETSP0794_2-20130614/24243_1 /TAXON_ID=515487 /ORGANISM="Stephanopyxis turris, Strain CCMP 815" /LENGTH=346 /DNA_ID=CAMNT_0040654647 /DNA_START=42 /DNA_END=1079 /DNA_ORIENTATION=-
MTPRTKNGVPYLFTTFATTLHTTRTISCCSALSLSMMMSSSSSSTSTTSSHKIIDSHLHVWANQKESSTGGYPYATNQTPPPSLIDRSSVDELLTQMQSANVNGALIVQPINHRFDHSYAASAIAAHPRKFKGMMLHDPSLSKQDALSRLEELLLLGFVGVRFNPYLWPAKDGNGGNERMSDGVGMDVYERCGQLKMPVGVMCFKGLQLHYDDIVALIEASPDTMLILDHFGFTALSSNSNKNDKEEEVFQMLLSLSQYESVHVKISALFRQNDTAPYENVKEKRLDPLLKAFGAERLLFGTDFPFVLEQEEGYKGTVELVNSWVEKDSDRNMLMGGTSERLFGPW